MKRDNAAISYYCAVRQTIFNIEWCVENRKKKCILHITFWQMSDWIKTLLIKLLRCASLVIFSVVVWLVWGLVPQPMVGVNALIALYYCACHSRDGCNVILLLLSKRRCVLKP